MSAILVYRLVARQHYLPAGVEELVESVEKFLLAPFLSREELHVVYEQNVRIAVPLAEVGDVPVRAGAATYSFTKFSEEM